MEKFPSIFNDVIGPVMRGPSSSHCAASLRIGRLCLDLMHGDIRDVYIEFDPNGSLATTHKGQGTDMGLIGGFMGWSADDERLPDYQQAADAIGMKIRIDIHPIGATHPNTYQITLKNDSETHQLIALSTGGGMIDVISIDGAAVQMNGDFFETLIYTNTDLIGAIPEIKNHSEFIQAHQGTKSFTEIKSVDPLPESILLKIKSLDVEFVRVLKPVLPVLSRRNLTVPFITAPEMEAYNEGKDLSLWELAVNYEMMRGNISAEEVV